MQRPVYKGDFFLGNDSLTPLCYDSDCDSGDECREIETMCSQAHYYYSGRERAKLKIISKDYDISENTLIELITYKPAYYVVKIFSILTVNQSFKDPIICKFLRKHEFIGYYAFVGY